MSPETENHHRRGAVLHLFQCTNLGGMEQVTFRVMDKLIARGISFHIATPRPFGLGVDRVRRFDPMARDFRYRGRFGWRDFLTFKKHVHALAKECSHIWVTGTSAACLAALADLPHPKLLSHHYHHLEGKFSYLRWRLFYECLCRKLDVITYPTEMTRNEAIRIAPWLKSKTRVVRNGIDVSYVDAITHQARRIEARRRLGIPENAFVVGNAGWLVRRKRFDVFLNVAAMVRARIPESLFVICGGGEEEAALRSLAHNLNLADLVWFTGWTQNLALHYRAWDALLFNTDFDTLPSTLMEAAAEGCIVVASQLYGGLGELIEHGRNGYLFQSHDLKALANALLDVRENPTHVECLRQQAMATLRSRFS